MKSPLDQAQILLSKANNDLIAARTVLATGMALDTVCFHSQQAVEKSLKAVLAKNEVLYPKRHDLGELFNLVKPIIPVLEEYEEKIIEMTPFAVQMRYDDLFTPSMSESKFYFKTAHTVFEIVQKYFSNL